MQNKTEQNPMRYCYTNMRIGKIKKTEMSSVGDYVD